MIQQLKTFIRENNLNIYDIAIMTEDGIKEMYCQPCNRCNASYSVTKLFIVTMIGILIDNKLLNLDEKIVDILSDEIKCPFDPIWKRVTVRHALTHSMGIEEGIIDIDRDDTSRYETENYLSIILDNPPQHEPGSYRMYTDVPHYLLSHIIEKVTGKKADEVIGERILKPLHFASTAWARCPMNHTIGSSGTYMSSYDMVKIAWLYQNYGVYEGIQIVSKEWTEMVQREEFDLYSIENSGFYGKGGLYSQMVMFNRSRNISVAWHAYELDERCIPLMVQFFEEVV